jgi:hypothetical protein
MRPSREGPLTPALPHDPVIDAYKKDVDRTLLRENLKLSVGERLEKLQSFIRALAEVRGVAAHR